MLVVAGVDGVDAGHVFGGEGGLVDGLECVFYLLEFGHVEVLAAGFGYLLETLLIQFPHLDVSFIGCYQLLVLALCPQPLHICNSLGDLLTFEGVELAAVGLKLSVILDGVLLFRGWLLHFKDNNSACVIAQGEVFAGFVEGYLRDYVFLLDFFTWSLVAEHLCKLIISSVVWRF